VQGSNASLKFDANALAPNFERDWNLPPTLVAIQSLDGKCTPKMMRSFGAALWWRSGITLRV
jgi:hypothetical protein